VLTSLSQKSPQVATKHQHWMSRDGWQAGLDPLPHGVAMDTEEPGSLFDGVVPVDLRELVIQSPRHDSSRPGVTSAPLALPAMRQHRTHASQRSQEKAGLALVIRLAAADARWLRG
jgi:hypothetical protein